MPSAEYDLRYLRAGLELLEKYLLSQDLYWPIGVKTPAGEPPYPPLTLGSLKLSQLRARARVKTSEQQVELARLDEQIDAVRSRWRAAWSQKAAAEFRSRLNLWRNFIEDYREQPAANIDRYSYEVGRRVQLYLLAQDMDDIPQADANLLNGLDKYLAAVFLSGPFVWEAELAPSFPPDPYWYLYGLPRRE